MSLLEAIKKLADENKASLNEKKGVYTFQMLVAERKTFLSKQRLEYIAKFRLDDALKEVKFTEMLKETASGLVSGGSVDDISPGFGFKATNTKAVLGGGKEPSRNNPSFSERGTTTSLISRNPQAV